MSKWAKWSWNSRSMTPIFNTSGEYPRMHVWCQFGDSGWTLLWSHNERDGVSNHQPHDCLLNRLFKAQIKEHQSSGSLPFVRGIHRWTVNSPHKGPVTRKMLPLDDVIMNLWRVIVRTRKKIKATDGLRDGHTGPTTISLRPESNGVKRLREKSLF